MTAPPAAALPRSFFARPADTVAEALLGCRLVSRVGGSVTGGRIVETEAYGAGGAVDLASHGSKNGGRPTARNASMFGLPGMAYVYQIYGLHVCLNVSTDAEGIGGAVLLRAIEPLWGRAVMATRRGSRGASNLADGPAKLCQALGVERGHDGQDLCDASGALWICADDRPARARGPVARGPRVGLGRVPEPWLSLPWRFRELASGQTASALSSPANPRR